MLQDGHLVTFTGKKMVLLARNFYITGGSLVLLYEIDPVNDVFLMM